MCTLPIAHLHKPEVSLQMLVLSLHHVGPRDETQVVRLGVRCLYSLSHLAGPKYVHLQCTLLSNIKTFGMLIAYLDHYLLQYGSSDSFSLAHDCELGRVSLENCVA